ncbi:MAG: hypothetical protein IKS35_00670 [Clostridia bacterium]|nr:hypothetical protein [Clostridia bacterium]
MDENCCEIAEDVQNSLKKQIGLTRLEIRAMAFIENSYRKGETGAVTVRTLVQGARCSKDTLYEVYGGKEGVVSSILHKIEEWLDSFMTLEDGRIRLVAKQAELECYMAFLNQFPMLSLKFLKLDLYAKRKPFSTFLSADDVDRYRKERCLFFLGGVTETARVWLEKRIQSGTPHEDSRELAQKAYSEIPFIERWINDGLE